MGWTNSQAETIVGLAFTYLTTTVLFSTGSAVTFGVGSTMQVDVDLNIASPAGIVWDATMRVDRDGDGIDIDGASAMTATSNLTNQLATPGTVAAAGYVDMVDAYRTFTKKTTNSGLLVFVTVGCFSTGVNTVARIGVETGGADSDISQLEFVTANEPQQLSGVKLLEVGSAPGPYTVQLRWQRVSGAGTLTQTANEIVCITVMEG